MVLVDGPDLHKRVREATGGAKLMLGIDAIGGPATDRVRGLPEQGGAPGRLRSDEWPAGAGVGSLLRVSMT